jgi:hypothetical protein
MRPMLSPPLALTATTSIATNLAVTPIDACD